MVLVQDGDTENKLGMVFGWGFETEKKYVMVFVWRIEPEN